MIAHFESAPQLILSAVWRSSWQAVLLAAIVLLLQSLLGKRLGGRGRYALWAVVLLRLLLPALPESRWSLFNLARVSRGAVNLVTENAKPRDAKPQSGEVPIIVIGGLAPSLDARPVAIVSTTPLTTQPSHPIPWVTWLFAAWLAGFLTIALRIVEVCWTLSRTNKRLPRVDDPQLIALLKSCGNTLHLRRLPTVLTGPDIHTPAVVGLFAPKLLLPATVLENCNPRELRLIVLHELAHLKRHDIAGNWLITLATILHWFNPIVWLLAARMRADRELACDELVLAHSENESQAYGQTLLKLIEILSPRPAQRQLVGILESTTPLQRRVRMIAQFDPKRSYRWLWTAAVLGLLGCAALTDAVRAEQKQTKPSPTMTMSPSAAPTSRPSDLVDLAVPGASQSQLVTKSYDVSSLVLVNDPSNNAEQKITKLITLVETFVDSNTWRNNGGADGTIQGLNLHLIVQQTPATQQKVADFLKLLTDQQQASAGQPPVPSVNGGQLVPQPGGFNAPAAWQGITPHTVVNDEQIETRNRAAIDLLHKTVPELKFDGTALSDVIDFLRDTTKANITANWRLLESAGIDRTAQVTLHVRDVSLESALNNVLKQANGDGLAIVIDNGVITITTRDDTASYLLTKTYDVNDLAAAGSGNIEALTGVVSRVASEQGSYTDVQSFNGKLVITATQLTHEQIDKLLADLHKKPVTPPAK